MSLITTTDPQTKMKNNPSWSKAILPPAQEFGPTPLPLISGEIPQTLRGGFYRNGPGRLERGGRRMGHWFDGDGAILGVDFTGTAATATYRYVKTAAYQDEEKAGKLLYGGYGMNPPVPLWQRLRYGLKNAANTSVLPLEDKLLALWEGGHPHALDLNSLETIGIDDLGWLKPGWSYSAHPKIDPTTGEIYNFGIRVEKDAILQVYRTNKNGELIKANNIKLQAVPVIHDFVLAGQYLVFIVPAVRLKILPVLLQLKTYSEALTWEPSKGTQILVLDRDTLELVSQGEADPWFQWHFGNGFVEADGSVVLDIARYDDFETNLRLKEVAAGVTKTAAKASFWQMRLDPKTGQVIQMQQLLDRSCEFPTVAPAEVGQPARFTYLSLHGPGVDINRELYNTIGRFDSKTGILTEANLGENRYPTEPLYAPDAENRDKGWVLTVVFDGGENQSEVWIFDAEKLDEMPVCRLGLPSVVPMGFHGMGKW